ncbi:hypothetical protein CERSUDRAFT_80692 [Gelatoporia subvermispora B]|uniref:Transmembrane protein n=1 Tax=Ceriporiopsis subvermispora (strain B) TaxID=914234 RepID=M2RRI5_CERS8|nr:hypothetical protein CERSUDRAFT_80692 [Gelatoporia subvermispora B]
MVDWSSPVELARDEEVFEKLMFAVFGVYVWELFQTSAFEWSLFSGKRKFTWPLVPFFLCRYCLLLALIGLLISLSVTTPINCNALFLFNSWAGNMTILCASMCLMLRSIALWDRKLKVVIPLGLLAFAHWVLLWRGMFLLKSEYDSTTSGCVVTYTNHVFLNVTFFTTMGFDAIILILNAAVLTRHQTHSDLWRLLFKDGLVYFIVTFCLNALPAILNVLNLNAMMNVMTTVPAATFAAITACRAVIRLQTFAHSDAYVHSTSQIASPGITRGGATLRLSKLPPAARLGGLGARPEVHVHTDHIVMEDFASSPDTHEPKKDGRLYVSENDDSDVSLEKPAYPARVYSAV